MRIPAARRSTWLSLHVPWASVQDVEKVVLLTRRVIDSHVSPDYAQEFEPLSEKASIVRIECGEQKYLRKEMLWDSLENFSDNTLFI